MTMCQIYELRTLIKATSRKNGTGEESGERAREPGGQADASH